MKNWVKSHPRVKRAVLTLMRVLAPMAGIVSSFAAVVRFPAFLADWLRYKRLGGKARAVDFYPCLFDKTASTGIDTHYFYQAVWGMRRIVESQAKKHVDIGSDVRFVGMLTSVTDVTFIDIRPLQLNIPNFRGVEGSLLALPYADHSVHSISCLHVLEHVGLGRYGDPLDPDGTKQACAELSRILAPGGRLYVSMPIGDARVQFNGQRIHALRDIRQLFANLNVLELSVVDSTGVFREKIVWADDFDLGNGGLDFGLGMFVFTLA